MILKELEIENFRIFPYLSISFSDGINIISGINGQGKTSILESIYYLALTKSFRTVNDNNVVSYNKNHFNIVSKFFSDSTKDKKIRLYYSLSEGKHLFADKKEIVKFSEHIGTIPCVILTLDDLKLTYGGPQERRKFLDILISQISSVYLEDLKIYRRTVQQKNALLGSDNRNTIKKQIAVWNEKLIYHGSRIILHRLSFVRFLNENLTNYYNLISVTDDRIYVRYDSSIDKEISIDKEDSLKERFYRKIEQVFNQECERKRSLIGPHRDDLQFFKNDRLFKDFCSQGENKTLVIALKFLEWEYISSERRVKPIFLLDDIFGELDEIRMHGLLKYLENIGQAHITTTMQDKFKTHLPSKKFVLKEKTIFYD